MCVNDKAERRLVTEVMEMLHITTGSSSGRGCWSFHSRFSLPSVL